MLKPTLLALALLALADIRGTSAAELETLRYGIGEGGGLSRLPLTVGLRQGFYQREGINLQPVLRKGALPMDTVNLLLDGLAAGEIDVVPTQLDFMAVRATRGADLVAIAGATVNPVYTLMSRPEVASFADLKGKTIALTLVDDAITLSMRQLMENHGLKDGEVHIGLIQGSQARTQCLMSGECAAVPVNQPLDFDLVARGYHRLGTAIEGGPLLFTVDTIMRAWGRAHKDLVVRYVRAAAAILDFIGDRRNRDTVRPIVMELTNANRATAEKVLDSYYDPDQHILAPHAELNAAALARNIALMDKYEKLPQPHPAAGEFVDVSYLGAAGVK
ncbi:MAG TPA: ABC transporter substrate-binding protein [Xanthobacteraceae bacterium]|nr:ABC transporter substrate-binding protein [Xanthobacteraceae bacterium]